MNSEPADEYVTTPPASLPLRGHQGVEDVIGQDPSDRVAVIVHNDKGEPTGLHELAGHIVGGGMRTYGHHVLVGQERGDPGVG